MRLTTTKDTDTTCGIGIFRPDFLQCFASVAVFTAFFSPAALITQALNVYIASQLTTIEKFFGLSSSQSGFLMGCNDIGYLLTILLASYFARRVHIPRAMAIATICYGISAYLCSLAYFFTPDEFIPRFDKDADSNSSHNSGLLCKSRNGSRDIGCDESSAHKVGVSSMYTKVAMALIATGMILQGCGKAPRQPYVATYLDDNSKKQKTSCFLGIITCVGIFGPSMGFVLGGVFSRMYVTLEDVPIGFKDERWIGAWWLGFIVFGSMAILIACPLFLFPKYMSKQTKSNACARSEKIKNRKKGVKRGQVFRRLLTNPRFMLMLFTTTTAIFVIAGLQAYQAKYLQRQFSLPTWKANILMGLLTTLAASIGSLSGGMLVNFLKLSPLSLIKYVTSVHFICIFAPVVQLFIGCPISPIVGLSDEGHPKYMMSLSSVPNVTDTCLDSCLCIDDYAPICGSNGINYFSPCHAGCMTEKQDEYGSIKGYSNCSCIADDGIAKPGLCDKDCSFLWLYLALMFVSSFIRASTIVPSVIFKMRSVQDKDKSMALGVSGFCHALFAWLAAPVVVGMLVDTCCIIWNQDECTGERGSCALYDNDDFRYVRHMVEIVAKVITLIFAFSTFLVSRNRTDWSTDPHTREEEIPEGDALMTIKNEKNDDIFKKGNIN